MDLTTILYVESTPQDKQTGTRTNFIAPSKLELLGLKIQLLNLVVFDP